MVRIVMSENITSEEDRAAAVGGNYMEKVLELQKLHPGSGIHQVLILHDPWCAMLRREGPCNCDPQVKYYEGQNNGQG